MFNKKFLIISIFILVVLISVGSIYFLVRGPIQKVSEQQKQENFVSNKSKIYGPYYNVWDYKTGQGFGFSTWDEKNGFKNYIRVKDKVFGPYQQVLGLMINGDRYSFRYIDNGAEYVNESGKIYGPYISVWGDYFDKGIAKIKTYEDGDEHFIIFSGKTYGPFDNAVSGSIFTKGNFAYIDSGGQIEKLDGFFPKTNLSDKLFGFEYKKDDQWYVNINDAIYGPYDEAFGTVLDGENFAFKYKKNNNWYINFNNNIISSSEGGLFSIKGGKIAYVDQENINDSGAFVKIKTEIYGPYDGVKELDLQEDSLGFVYSQNGHYYANINKTIFGPYDDVRDLGISASIFGFEYKTNDNWYIKTKNSNDLKDNTYGPYDDVYSLVVGDYWHFGFKYKSAGFWNVNLDGRVYFGNDSVEYVDFFGDNFVFSYVKEGESYVNINGEIKGPYKLSSIRLNEKGNYCLDYNIKDPKQILSNYVEFGELK